MTTDSSVGNLPIHDSVETFPKAPIPGTKLDMPRLDPPRGPARGRARANLRDLMYRMFVYHSYGTRSPVDISEFLLSVSTHFNM
eukprot:COSAG02_NODE_920_length_15934_cov_11.363751_2_plen_84_part_00